MSKLRLVTQTQTGLADTDSYEELPLKKMSKNFKPTPNFAFLVTKSNKSCICSFFLSFSVYFRTEIAIFGNFLQVIRANQLLSGRELYKKSLVGIMTAELSQLRQQIEKNGK